MLNVICINGRLARDPELRTTGSGTNVASLTVAVDRNRADADGNRQADFIDVVAWRGTADFVCKYFHKGDMIAVNGALQTRSYEDKQGAKRKAYEIVADGVSFCGGKSDSGNRRGDADDSEFNQPVKAEPANFTVADDADLPF